MNLQKWPDSDNVRRDGVDKRLRYRDRLRSFVTLEQATNDRDRTIGNRSSVAEELETVSYAFGTDFDYGNVDIQDLFESNRGAIVTLGIDARKTDFRPADFVYDAEV